MPNGTAGSGTQFSTHCPRYSLGDIHWSNRALENFRPDLANQVTDIWLSVVTAEGFGIVGRIQ